MKQRSKESPMRTKLLKIALELYLEYGFSATTNQMIVKRANCSPGELTHFFGTKENILCEVVRMVLPTHQETLEGSGDQNIPSEIRYTLEIAVELSMCEQNEVIRDLYINAYTLPKTINLIRDNFYQKSYKLFKDYLPSWTETDFYETEVLSMGIVYSALMDRCSVRYNIKQKIARVIDALLKIYEFSKERREETKKAISQINVEEFAKKAEKEMLKQIEQVLNSK